MDLTQKGSRSDVERLIEEGMSLRVRGEYRLAQKRFESAAELGSARALYLAGENAGDVLLKTKQSVLAPYVVFAKDCVYRQFDYYYRSAEGGYAPAMLRLADLYREGCVLFEPNPEKAVKWYGTALRFGEEEAREKLALCYEEGFGVEKSQEIAEKIRNGASFF